LTKLPPLVWCLLFWRCVTSDMRRRRRTLTYLLTYLKL